MPKTAFFTRKQIRDQIMEVGTWVAAAILGVGVGLSITVVLMPAGMGLIVLGAFVGTVGWVASLLVPGFFRYQTMQCPYCHEINQVRLTAVEYGCDGCGRKLRGAGFWRRGKESRQPRGPKTRLAQKVKQGA
ncbi:hypothetical protein SY88_11975 [Clostridiales bacterium PH28_bin88]|nr:hypothetical protein SY88_11975 [Clostridiales bacterium PH28_bin88]